MPYKKSFLFLGLFCAIIAFMYFGWYVMKRSFSPVLQKAMEDVVQQEMKRNNLPGVIIGVWVPGKGEWVRAFGKSDLKNNIPMHAQDQVRIASISKTFGAILTLQLVDEGKIQLDDTIDRYYPDVPHANIITIRQLLTMTSGLADYLENPQFAKEVFNNLEKQWTPQELLSYSRTLPLYPPDKTPSLDGALPEGFRPRAVDKDTVGSPEGLHFSPGKGCYYSNTNYVVLSIILEKVTGKKLADLLKERITQPLGLHHTFLPQDNTIPADMVHGYSMVEHNGQLSDSTGLHPSVAWGFAGMVISNLYDLHRWIRLLGRGSCISPQSHRAQLMWSEVSFGKPYYSHYGMGIIYDETGFIGHNGAMLGYNSAAFYLPRQDATIVVLVNRYDMPKTPQYAHEIFVRIVEILFPKKMNG